MSDTSTIAKPAASSKARRKLLVMLASMSCGAIIGFLSVAGLGKYRARILPLDSPGVLLLSLVPIWFAVVLIHELGHLLGGWLCGHRFYMLIVGPLRITRDLTGLRVGLTRTFALSGGLAVCLPTKLDNFVRERMVMVFMGPFASVLLASVCWSAVFGLSPRPSWLVDVLTVSALLCTVTSCVSLLPHHTGGFPSDGAQLLGLMRGDANSEKLTLVMLLQTISCSGTRPRDWQEELVHKANLIKSTHPIYNACADMLAYYFYIDRHERDLAQAHLEKALADFDSLPDGVRQGFAVEAASFWAFRGQDLAKSEEWLARGAGGLVDPAARSRAEAAVLLLKGQTQPALEKIHLARQQLRSSIDRGGAIVEGEILDAMEANITSRVGVCVHVLNSSKSILH